MLRRITTQNGSITSVQAVYVPADDLTDPAPATTFAHLDATTVLSRKIAEKGIYPAVDPLDSTSRILEPDVVGEEHYAVARNVQQVLQRYKDLQDIIAILGIDELSEEDKIIVGRARGSSFPEPALLRGQAFTGFEKCVSGRHHPRLQGDPRASTMTCLSRLSPGRHHRGSHREGEAMAEVRMSIHVEIVTPYEVAYEGDCGWRRTGCSVVGVLDMHAQTLRSPPRVSSPAQGGTKFVVGPGFAGSVPTA